MIALFALLLVALLALLNSYPIIASRDLVLRSKKSTMQSQAAVMSSSLSALETLSADGVEQVMELIDVMPLTRIIVTDDAGLILYDSSAEDSAVGRWAMLREIADALSGHTVSAYAYTAGVFTSRAAMPVVSPAGAVMGAVYLYEYDAEQGGYITGLQRNLRNTSLAFGGLGLLLMAILSSTLTRRIKRLAAAVRVVENGDYAYRIKVQGSDEVTELSEEFNVLTGRLEATEEARRRFVSDASHELRTPLAAIRLLSDSITQSGEMDAATMREFVSDIGSEAERLQRTTEKLMCLTKLDAGASQTRRERVDVAEVVRRTMHLLGPLADAQNVSIVTDLAAGCTVLASADDLYQIIFNLMENGIKYNLSGGSVRLTLRRQEAVVRFTVEDTGIGIPEAELPSVFERFYRVDKARSRASGGSGLGLSIVHDAVEANGGSVEVARRQPNGTRFTVTFPYYEEKGARG